MQKTHTEAGKKLVYIILITIMVLSAASSGIIIYLNSRPLSNKDMQAQLIKTGSGEEVKSGDKVSVLYKGSLADGTVFDESAKHNNEPLEFTVGSGQIIKGFDDAMIGMKVGDKKKITLTPDMAYGNQQVGNIPPNSTLIFEIELLKIN
ncbi:MAG TPA: FKBP-type peptidyl-prolyl cis-trans isomerase [Candidatus Paceibacterota bacterium]|nr:FKBP-type peptidyl-prolyl cis-trans isomerase [Candidatus Paceibacterota bacterium]